MSLPPCTSTWRKTGFKLFMVSPCTSTWRKNSSSRVSLPACTSTWRKNSSSVWVCLHVPVPGEKNSSSEWVCTARTCTWRKNNSSKSTVCLHVPVPGEKTVQVSELMLACTQYLKTAQIKGVGLPPCTSTSRKNSSIVPSCSAPGWAPCPRPGVPLPW